jgi:hypothetical protein
MVRRFWRWFCEIVIGPAPAAAPPVPLLDRLYVLKVDFEVNPKLRTELEKNLDILRRSYAVDFFLQEPGMVLSRFDGIK